MVAATEKMGIGVGWVDKVIKEISAKRDHFTLLQEARLLRIHLKELQEQIKKVGHTLLGSSTEMLYRDFSSHSIENHKMQVVKDDEQSCNVILLFFMNDRLFLFVV